MTNGHQRVCYIYQRSAHADARQTNSVGGRDGLRRRGRVVDAAGRGVSSRARSGARLWALARARWTTTSWQRLSGDFRNSLTPPWTRSARPRSSSASGPNRSARFYPAFPLSRRASSPLTPLPLVSLAPLRQAFLEENVTFSAKSIKAEQQIQVGAVLRRPAADYASLAQTAPLDPAPSTPPLCLSLDLAVSRSLAISTHTSLSPFPFAYVCACGSVRVYRHTRTVTYTAV